ncbi:MAG: DUF2326 domain-containing protein, partial [Promethearchaeota archaeon]
ENMKIFCYDLALMQGSQYKPDFLIHDSLLYDGVDERQIARAFELAAQESEKLGFQYICTLNSDDFPESYLSNQFKSKLEHYTCIKLTDKTIEGSLLGIRF